MNVCVCVCVCVYVYVCVCVCVIIISRQMTEYSDFFLWFLIINLRNYLSKLRLVLFSYLLTIHYDTKLKTSSIY